MAYLIVIYAMIILTGGVMGYVKAESLASLIMGLSFGVALLISAALAFLGKIQGYFAALVIAFLLDGFFTYRFVITGAFFPAGMLTLLSLGMIIALVSYLRRT